MVIATGTVLGSLLGYIYWLKIGCTSGSCAITSSPFWSTLYGAILGYYLIDLGYKLIQKFLVTPSNNNNE